MKTGSKRDITFEFPMYKFPTQKRNWKMYFQENCFKDCVDIFFFFFFNLSLKGGKNEEGEKKLEFG